MGLCLYGRGIYSGWNLLADPAVVITPDNESTTHPKALLVDGNPGKPFRFLSDGTDRKITFDLGSAKKGELLTIHYHNLTAGITAIELRYSTDNFAADNNLAAKIVPLYDRSSMYIWVPGGFSKRYWRVVFVGTNGSAIWIGEITLSSPLQSMAKPLGKVRVEHQEKHARHTAATGRKEVFEKLAWEVRYVASSFLGTLAARDEVVEKVYRGSRGDLRPMLYVPRAPSTLVTAGGFQVFDGNEKVAVFGHLDPPELIEEQDKPGLVRWTVGVLEDPSTEPLA